MQRLSALLAGSLISIAILSGVLTGQQSPQSSAVVPRLVNYSGKAIDVQGKVITGAAGITFSIYSEETGGAPLWLETQNVQIDSKGNYAVQLGATKSDGLPLELFTQGGARWLGVRVNGAEEQARVLLLSVPYALKAADAETVGGLPASAFMLAGPVNMAAPMASNSAPASPLVSPPASAVTTSGGTVGALPLWTTGTNIQSSVVMQTGIGTTAKIGINTSTPTSTLDVKGATTVRGALILPATGTASAAAGKNSQPEKLSASVFNSSTGTPVTQTFQWQTEPVANNTASANGALHLLYASGTNTPAETGLNIAKNGQITFAPNQSFAGLSGVVSSVGLSVPSDFTIKGSPVTGSGSLALNWTVPPDSADTANAIVKRDANGSFSAGPISSSTATTSTPALEGTDNSPTWGTAGVFGSTANSMGVVGVALGPEGTAVETIFGVFGANDGSVLGAGVYGRMGLPSNTGGYWAGHGAGVWGDGGDLSENYGVLGTADAYPAGIFLNNASTFYALYAQNNSAGGSPFAAFNGSNKGCWIDSSGDINCTGSKNAVVPIDGGRRRVAMAAIESPKNWFEDFGSDRLFDGAAVVNLEWEFAQTVNAGVEYHVFLTPNGDCKGLYVSRKRSDSFEVRELGGGVSNVSFDYRIVALRKNYENVRLADHTHDIGPMPMPRRASPLRLEVNRIPPRSQAASAHPIVNTTAKK
jgi:hypothetical protein